MKPAAVAKSKILRFAKGSLIVRESEVSGDAYIIVSGRVEIFKEEKGKRAVLARLGPGQVFGEMSLILEKPRTAAALAIEETFVRRIDVEAFARALKKNPEKLAPFMKILLERLRTMNTKLMYSAGAVIKTDGAQAASDHPATKIQGVPTLVGVTPDAKRSLLSHHNALRIVSFPFKIGRKVDKLFTEFISHNDIYLHDDPPFHVSRNHCSINKTPDESKYFVQDRGSTLGTIVNDKLLGGMSDENEAILNQEENELILGTADSIFRFKIVFANEKI